MGCQFQTAVADAAPLDPHKRVRHFTGLVLGADEFQQDQLYFMERGRLHQRALHGYGTAMGLGVRVRDNAAGRPEVLVDPGLAVTPRGDSVCVAQAQCASLDGWLTVHGDELSGPPASPPASPPTDAMLWVVLCARECATDPVPVLGDPCRTTEDATAPSRIADDFELQLVVTPPEHLEEAAVRLFGQLMRMVQVSDVGSPLLAPEELAELVRRIVPMGSPAQLPALEELLDGSPPLGGSPPDAALFVHPDDAEAASRAVQREWIAAVRPRLAAGAAGCAGRGERCVLLARLEFGVTTTAEGLRVDGPVAVDDVNRPWLLHTRLVQELSSTAWLREGAD